MNDQLTACLMLLENILYNPRKYTRQEFKNKLKEEGLSHSDSSVTRVLQKISQDFGIRIRQSKTAYVIIEEDSDSDYLNKFQNIKTLLFRQIIQNNIVENTIIGDYISFGSTTHNKGVEFIEDVLKAILEKRKLKLSYQAFYESETKEYTVNPLFLREYQNRWYLIVDKNEGRENTTFAFDRIQQLHILKNTFNSQPVNKKLFQNTIGVIYSDTIENVVLWFSPLQAKYVKTLPLHSSQQLMSEDEKGAVFSLKVNINLELEQLIKAYGSAVRVLQPESLKQTIIEECRKSLVQYEI